MAEGWFSVARIRSAVMSTLLAAILVGATSVVAGAQVSPDSSWVRGVIREQSGRPVADALLRWMPGEVVTTSDAEGRFALAVPVWVAGSLVIRRVGFEPVGLAISALRPGERRDIGVTLPGLARLDVMSVVAERPRPLVNTKDAATGGAIDRAELQHLPTDARDPIAVAYNIPGVAQGTGFFGDAPKLTADGANGL